MPSLSQSFTLCREHPCPNDWQSPAVRPLVQQTTLKAIIVVVASLQGYLVPPNWRFQGFNVKWRPLFFFGTKKIIVCLFTHLVLARFEPLSPAPLKWQQMILSLDKDRPPVLPIYFLEGWAHFQNFQQVCRHEYNVRYPSIFLIPTINMKTSR